MEVTPSLKGTHFHHNTSFCTVAVGGLLGLRGKGVDCVFRLMGRKIKKCIRTQNHGRKQNQGAVGWKHLEVVRRVQTLWRP